MVKAEGIPPTASTASVGKGINYVGNYAYAMSGLVLTLTGVAYKNMLDFTTGAGLIKGDFNLIGALDKGNPQSGIESLYKIQFNEVEVFYVNIDSGKENSPSWCFFPILIPPFTRVQVDIAASASAYETFCGLVGRVYGAE